MTSEGGAMNIDNVQEYLHQREGQFRDIVPGTEKSLLWAEKNPVQTDYALVYIHGFSASRQETNPLCAILAESLGANVFFTRLAGHGRTSEALGEVELQNWVDDYREAIEVGLCIGKKLLVIGVSTGGTLATWGAACFDHPRVAAYMCLSPNYRPKNPFAALALWPWARIWLPLIMPEVSFEPRNEDHRRYWTERYPVEGVFPMMELLKLVRKSPVERITKPFQILYSPQDQVVDSRMTEKIFTRIGSDARSLVPRFKSDDFENHLLAGDILSPSTTDEVAGIMLEFIKAL